MRWDLVSARGRGVGLWMWLSVLSDIDQDAKGIGSSIVYGGFCSSHAMRSNPCRVRPHLQSAWSFVSFIMVVIAGSGTACSSATFFVCFGRPVMVCKVALWLKHLKVFDVGLIQVVDRGSICDSAHCDSSDH